MLIFLDNSQISSYRDCPRYYYFRYVRDWTTAKDAIALVAGSAWHKGLDLMWDHPEEDIIAEAAAEVWAEYMLENDYDIYSPTFGLEQFRTLGCFKEMFLSYYDQRKTFLREIQLLSVEQPFVVPVGPGTETDQVFYTGILDKVFEYRDRIHICDHKTTSMYAKAGGFRPIWINSFSPNTQIEGYQYAGIILHGDKFDDVWIDGALVHKTVHDRFIFLPQKRSMNMLEAWLVEANLWIGRILEDLSLHQGASPDEPVLNCFPKSAPNSCSNYGRECLYKDICMTITNPDRFETPPEGFYVRPWDPVDEAELRKLIEGDSN